jgi:hypothetical protein
VTTVFYAIIAPKWRALRRPVPGLGTRPLLRWQLVRETRPVIHDGIAVSGYEHVSYHWTYRAAWQAAWRRRTA